MGEVLPFLGDDPFLLRERSDSREILDELPRQLRRPLVIAFRFSHDGRLWRFGSLQSVNDAQLRQPFADPGGRGAFVNEARDERPLVGPMLGSLGWEAGLFVPTEKASTGTKNGCLTKMFDE